MAVYFRHGSNGAYKSAYVVWFEILPALRAGRIVVTNVEGLKPLEEIEKILGEKFPVTAKLIRIFSRSETGVWLWQNWFNWMPCTALVVIDECQDLYTSDVGFKREKGQRIPFENFKDKLPDYFNDLFHEYWGKVDVDNLQPGDEDDIGEVETDEQGRILYPFNFYGAFMRHRKYQWDIIMLTPDWTAIPTWLRGCAQEAYAHRSTDSFLRKRKPRIFNHRPNSTKTAPTTKSDFASTTSKKIPIDVFALYKSTGTGGHNESKADTSLFRSFKFWAVIVVMVLAFANTAREAMNVLSDNDENPVSEVTSETTSSVGVHQNSTIKTVGAASSSVQSASSVDNGGVHSQDTPAFLPDAVNPFFEHFSVFNGATSVYLTGVHKKIRISTQHEFIFRISKKEGDFYISSRVLERLGYRFFALDDCLVRVHSSAVNTVLSCPPIDSQPIAASGEHDKELDLKLGNIFSKDKDGV